MIANEKLKKRNGDRQKKSDDTIIESVVQNKTTSSRMLLVKAFHVIAMVAWFSGLFYLPRLFIYHVLSEDKISQERFKRMEKRLYWMIMTPAAFLTLFFGLWLLWDYAWVLYHKNLWLHIKLFLVVITLGYHHYCGRLLKELAQNQNTHSVKFYRWFNECPTLLLIVITILVIVKPF
jgi:putative membrane protein